MFIIDAWNIFDENLFITRKIIAINIKMKFKKNNWFIKIENFKEILDFIMQITNNYMYMYNYMYALINM